MALIVHAWAHQVGWYLRNAARGPEAETVFRLVEGYAERLADRMSDTEDEMEPEDGFGEDEADLEDDAASRPTPRKKLSLEQRRAELEEFLVHFSDKPPVDAAVENNVRYAAGEFGLDALDIEILLFVTRYSNNSLLEEFADEIHENIRHHSVPSAVAVLLGRSEQEVTERLCAGAPLIENGVLAIDPGGAGLAGVRGELRMTQALLKSMRQPHDTYESWSGTILGRPLAAQLPWDDYAHLGAISVLARDALSGWRTDAPQGVHLMLVGPPGTGKTELAKTLAEAAGVRLFSVGEASENGDEMGRTERLAALRMAFAMLRSKKDAALLMDEATDVLLSGSSYGARKADQSKIFLNRTLDTSPVPVIWACNSTREMDLATIRRMTLVVEVKTPDRKARRRIWARIAERGGVALGQEVTDGLADRWEAPPGVAASAVLAARLAGGSAAEVELALSSSMRALGLGASLPERDGSAFDMDLAVCTEDLRAFADSVSEPGAARDWSACFHGAPGTGKSEFARYLATRMGMPVLQKKASDLMSKWVGETEQKIAAAFAEARATGSVLIVDEIEAMIFDRRAAERSWEVSQVNEMLVWMETHPLPFIGTTNTTQHLDPASLRRFTFKPRFDTLDPARSALAFSRLLGETPPGRLPSGLAPGDFKVVRDRRKVLRSASPETLVRWLQEEVDAKGSVSREIGFHLGSREAPETERARRS